MNQISIKKLIIVYILLLMATLLAYAVAEMGADKRLLVAGLFAIAGFKIRLILRHFMELETAPRSWQLFFACWTWGCSIIIAGLFALGNYV